MRLALILGIVLSACGSRFQQYGAVHISDMQVTPDGTVHLLTDVSAWKGDVYGAVRDEARSQVVLRCLETEESDGVWLTECHPFVTTDELVDYLTDPTKGSGVFRHKRLPVFVVPKQWTDSGAAPQEPPELLDE